MTVSLYIIQQPFNTNENKSATKNNNIPVYLNIQAEMAYWYKHSDQSEFTFTL